MSAQQESIASSIPSIPLELLRPSMTEAQTQRRKYFDKAKLAELAESIATHGVLQPIIVRKINGEHGAGVTMPDYYEIVAGERRVRAAKEAGHVRIPANVVELTDAQVIEVQLIENLQREDVHPMQEAEGYYELLHKHGLPVEAIEAKLGETRSRSHIYARMKLLDLCPEARDAFYKETIDLSRALLIARIPGDDLQQRALKQITEKRWDGEGLRMSYREAQRYVHETFMLKLSTAPFARDDATLVPSAGACGPCPMRTGNAIDLFDDVKGADVCTNPSCFNAKKAAHLKRELEKASVAGAEVIRGAKAKRILPDTRFYGSSKRDPLRNGYARPKDKCPDDPKKRTYAELAGKDAPTVLLQHPDTGRIEKAIRLEDVADRLKEKGVRPPMDDAEKRERAQERDQRNEELNRAVTARTFQAIVAAAPKKLDRAGLIDVLAALGTTGYYPDEDLFNALDWPDDNAGRKEFAERVQSLGDGELAQLALAMTVADSIFYGYGDDKQFNALTKRLGVDVKKIRREVEREQKQAAAQPDESSTKPAKTRKGK